MALLSGGTGLSVLINILALPFLTRLYGAAEYGELAVYVSIATVLGIPATGRFEFAILDASTDVLARTALVACNACALTTSSLTFLGTLAFILYAGREGSLSAFLSALMLAIYVYAQSMHLALYHHGLRHKAFVTIAGQKLLPAALISGLSLVFALFETPISGLLLGLGIGTLVSTAIFAWRLSRIKFDGKVQKNARSLPMLRRWMFENRRYPINLVSSGLLDRASSQLHIWLFAGLFDLNTVGALALYQKAIGLPTRLIGSAVGDVFKQAASEQLRDTGNCHELLISYANRLVKIGLLMAIALVALGPWLFGLVFGSEWRLAGQFAQILGPMFCISFAVSPIGSLLFLGKNQKYDLLLQGILLPLTVAGIFLGYFTDHSAIGALGGYSCAYLCKYALEYHISKRISQGDGLEQL